MPITAGKQCSNYTIELLAGIHIIAYNQQSDLCNWGSIQNTIKPEFNE